MAISIDVLAVHEPRWTQCCAPARCSARIDWSHRQRWGAILAKLPSPQERRAIREQAGWSQDQLAEMVGCARSAITQWENGTRTPEGELLHRYLEALAKLAVGDLSDEQAAMAEVAGLMPATRPEGRQQAASAEDPGVVAPAAAPEPVPAVVQ